MLENVWNGYKVFGTTRKKNLDQFIGGFTFVAKLPITLPGG